jgi:hypothetical protein
MLMCFGLWVHKIFNIVLNLAKIDKLLSDTDYNYISN